MRFLKFQIIRAQVCFEVCKSS